MNNFRRFGTMVDCSRNAVMSVDALKRWIDITSDLGYNCLMLYMEDTYEIKGEPYFGHLRGRYSCEELREVDDYAAKKGMELIPCIQTLAHLNAIFRWGEYHDIKDCNDILLADEEKTYELIDKMFDTFNSCLRTKTINIGMDEAHFLGLGKYLKKHGFKDRTKILIDHLKAVSNIAKKYHFELLMWGDMFIRLANGGEYYVENFKASDEVKYCIPDNVRIIYWDYYSTDKNNYDNQIKNHKAIKNDIVFAGGLWTWGGPIPKNHFSIESNKVALTACVDGGVKDVFLTLWGDDGGECSKFAALPSLYHAACTSQGITDENEIKEGFLKKFGISFDDFMLIDLPNTKSTTIWGGAVTNPEKYMLYCDCLMGQYDYTVCDGDAEEYAACAQKLRSLENNAEFGYLFSKARALCELLSVKYNIGVRIRKAYLKKDFIALKAISDDCVQILKLIDDYYAVFKNEWYRDNKPHGFDIQDLRLGGLSRRVLACRGRLLQFLNGEIDVIEELNEPVLNLLNSKASYTGPIYEPQWYRIVSANVISLNVF